MEMNASVLKTLFNRLHKFVMGTADEQVDLGDGRKLPTLSGIEKQSKSMGMLQVCRDYSTLAIANADATANRLKPGQIIRVWDDIAKFNGYYELSSAMNLVKKDLVDLIGIQEIQQPIAIQRHSSGVRHVVFEMDVGKPLVGQSKHWFAEGLFHYTVGNMSQVVNYIVTFGFKEDGTTYSQVKFLNEAGTPDRPPYIIHLFMSHEGDSYRVSNEVTTELECAFFSKANIYPNSPRF